MVDQIAPNGRVISGQAGDGQLGADAVGGGHQEWIGETFERRPEEAAEGAQAGEHALGAGGGEQLRDLGEGLVLGIDVDTGSGVGVIAHRCTVWIGKRSAWRGWSLPTATR